MSVPPDDQQCCWTELSVLALVRVSGADAAEFLQAQLSNDVLRLGATRSELAAWCDAKGRALTVLRLLRRGDDYLLILPAALADTLQRRLRMFVLRARVELSGSADQLQKFAVFGNDADTAIAGLIAAPAVDEVTQAGDLQCLRLPGDIPSYMLIGPPTACLPVTQQLAERATLVNHARWELDRISAGQPQIFPQTQGAFVPQMLNLHWLGGVDFQKGCYPGQEVVARLQYRGKLTRRMFLAQMQDTQTPEPGTTVLTSENDTLGQVVAAAPVSANQQRLLAVLKVDGALPAANIYGAPLELLALPYATPD